MELSNIEVRLAGNLLHVLPKQNVTPAEIVVLRTIHGSDAVINVRPTRMDRRGHTEEFARLQERYGGALSRMKPPQSLEMLWPGLDKRLPVALKDIGVTPSLTPAPEPVAAAPDAPETELVDDEEAVAA